MAVQEYPILANNMHTFQSAMKIHIVSNLNSHFIERLLVQENAHRGLGGATSEVSQHRLCGSSFDAHSALRGKTSIACFTVVAPNDCAAVARPCDSGAESDWTAPPMTIAMLPCFNSMDMSSIAVRRSTM